MRELDLKKTLPWILYLIFFSVLNETVFNVSTPAISARFGLTPTGVSWMMTAFIMFFGTGTVVFGRLSDLFSIKRLLSIGIVIYAVGSAMGFVFQASYPLVLAARAIQGVGGSSLPALVMVIVARHFAPEVRGRLFGSIGSVVAFAAGIGPVIGGFVSGKLDWTWLFLIPLATLVALPFVARLLPDEERRSGKIDLIGAALMALGLGSLILWLTYPDWPWLVVGLVLLGLFALRILTVKEPFVDPSLFANGPYRSAVMTSLALFGVFMGIFFILPLILHQRKGLDSSVIGLVLFPGAISGIFFGPLAGRLADGRGNPFILAIGLLLLALGLGSFPLILDLPVWVMAAALVVVNIGVTFFQTGLINSVSQTLRPEETGVGMGVFNLVGFMAGAVGTAAVARILDAKLLDFGGVMALLATLIALAGGLYTLSLRRRLRAAAAGGTDSGSQPKEALATRPEEA